MPGTLGVRGVLTTITADRSTFPSVQRACPLLVRNHCMQRNAVSKSADERVQIIHDDISHIPFPVVPRRSGPCREQYTRYWYFADIRGALLMPLRHCLSHELADQTVYVFALFLAAGIRRHAAFDELSASTAAALRLRHSFLTRQQQHGCGKVPGDVPADGRGWLRCVDVHGRTCSIKAKRTWFSDAPPSS